MIESRTVPRRRREVEGHRFGPDFVLLDPSGTVLRGLNPTGAQVWELIDGLRTVEQIASAIARASGVGVERVIPDVVAFLSQLADRQLIEANV
jgi:hypothetical protein